MSVTPSIDAQALDRLHEWGGEALVLQMIRLFVRNAEGRMEQIRAGMRDEDIRELEMGAHSLKSSAANLGAERVRGLSAEIERAAGAGDLGPMARLLPELERAFADAVAELQTIERERSA